MPMPVRATSLLFACLFSSAVLIAQHASEEHTPPPLPADAMIHLDVIAAPAAGSPIAGLEQKDFTIRDNKLPQPIASFQAIHGSDAAAEIILVIDTVNVGYQTVSYERGEIDKFLQANGGRLAHPTALAIFTDKGTQLQNGFSVDGNALRTSLDTYTIGLRSIRQSAGFYGATERLQLSLNTLHMLALREGARPGRKLILWVSPGWPLLSGPGVELSSKQQQQSFNEIVALSAELRQAQITLYSIDPLGSSDVGIRTFYYQSFLKGVSRVDQVKLGNLGLQVLAVQSGGLALNSSNDLSGLLAQCVAYTQAFYEISFAPPHAARKDEYHHLEVEVNKPGIEARTRQGYYAQP